MCPSEGQAGSRQGCSRQHLQLTQARCQGLEWLHSLLLHSDICDWGPLSLNRRLLCCALRSLRQKLANKKQRELKKLLKAKVWKKHTCTPAPRRRLSPHLRRTGGKTRTSRGAPSNNELCGEWDMLRPVGARSLQEATRAKSSTETQAGMGRAFGPRMPRPAPIWPSQCLVHRRPKRPLPSSPRRRHGRQL